jgi:hypothetical protein
MKCKCCGQEIVKPKGKMKDNKDGWIYIPELEVYVEKDVHHKNYSYNQLKEIYGKDFEKMLLTKAQVEVLDASKTYRKIFKMRTWGNDFFIQQYNEDNKKQGYVAVFFSVGGRSYFGSGGDSVVAYDFRGVRFVRKKNSKKGAK